MKIYSKLLLGWIIVILLLTWTPGEALPKPEFLNVTLIGFLVHFGMFFVFSFLMTGAIIQTEKFNKASLNIFAVVLAASLIFSLLTELGQIFIPGRYFQVVDIIINFAGSITGAWLYIRKYKYFSD